MRVTAWRCTVGVVALRRIVAPWLGAATRRLPFPADKRAGAVIRLYLLTGSLLALGLSPSTNVFAQGGSFQKLQRPAAVPSDDELVANNAVVGDIIFRLQDIFDPSDPKENYAVFRAANTLHINTREFVVRDDLLFTTGDLYSPDLIYESERILRSRNYLFDAQIRPVYYENNRVDIEVRTRDVWTLSGGINYSRKGGENSYGYEIQEDNFAGLGKMVRIKRETDEFRTENEFRYFDPLLTPQRTQLTLGYSYNTDGRNKLFHLERPFYSLDARWAAGVQADTFSRQEILYKDGTEFDYYYQDEEYFDVRGGYSRGRVGDRTRRWQLGYTVDYNTFSATNVTLNPDLVPQTRELAYPWIQYDTIISRYIKTTRINLIGRTEDINLGATYYLRLGWSHTDFASDRNMLVFDFDYYNTNRTVADQLWLFNYKGSGRIGEGYTENLLFTGETRYFYPVFDNQVFYSELDFDFGHHLDEGNQLLLGGVYGLRGYEAHIQEGNRRVLLKLEQRYYTNIHLLQLAYVAGAVFFDVGQAWTPGITPAHYAGFLKDIGLGLRLAPSRTSKGTILHLDLAYALDAEAGDDNLQFVVSTESQF